MLDKHIDPKPIQEILKDRGNYKIKKSSRFKELIKFDEYWGHIFDLFYENPFLRLILQYFITKLRKEKLLDRFLDITTVLTDFRRDLMKIENSIPYSPLSIEVCPKCGGVDFLKKDRLGSKIYYCEGCRQQFDSPKMEPSLIKLGPSDMYVFLMELVNAGILTKGSPFFSL